MNRHPLKGLACLVLTVAASHAHAQPATVVKLKNGESLDWPAVTFKPAMCDELGCGTPSPKPKIRPKDFCIYAICLPLDAKAVKTVIPPDATHWRIYPNNTMQLFKGDTPLLAQAVAATSPLVDADRSQVGHTPVLVQADKNGTPITYWVRVTK
ncbi:MAG TPA: hypothetical protein PKD73_15715 [Burkholderiaceae bacterium]|nr:hypothetical protein [Burkholderiaceae bacterium]